MFTKKQSIFLVIITILVSAVVNMRVLPQDSELVTILTEWGENLDKTKILQEYPRPQFVRDSYLNLNGAWEYSLGKEETEPSKYDGEITVPFSIESPLSGVKGKSLQPGMTLWYKRIVDLTKIKDNGKFIINFGAVDQTTEVFVNDEKVGDHDGGYTGFHFDITQAARKSSLNSVKIVVKVIDNYAKDGAAFGKQGNPRGGIWYVQTGGIWQTVWIESIPKTYIKFVKITPNYDDHSVTFFPRVEGFQAGFGAINILNEDGTTLKTGELRANRETTIELPEDFKSWSPETPYLYNVTYTYLDDNVKSYFGMRKFSVGLDSKNIKRLFLNNKPYFHKGLLDQGYWSDGYYTPPADAAIINDLQTMKDLGFNMIRKHIKQEPMRWYYHCDRLGILVWQDQVSGGEFPFHHNDQLPDSSYSDYSRGSELGRQNYYRDLVRCMEQLYNCPCISTWVPFNEAWGQFDSVMISKFIKSLDPTRLVDHASGWVDHGASDLKSIHDYDEHPSISQDSHGRVVVLSEYGGLGIRIEGHVGSTKSSAYRMYNTLEELNEALRVLIEDNVAPLISKGLSATVYTQVSDVEDEVNGMFTYDRKILKANKTLIKAANDKLHY